MLLIISTGGLNCPFCSHHAHTQLQFHSSKQNHEFEAEVARSVIEE